MKKYLLLLSLAVGCMTANAEAPQRPMLEQGKSWTYVYHHYEDGETPDPDGTYKGQETFFSWYTLKGDTVIDGRQYMKMYRNDEVRSKESYYGAYREDEEGRVYRIIYSSPEEECKIVDFSTDFKSLYPNIIEETIKVEGQLFRRYSYQDIMTDGSTRNRIVGVEGIGYQEGGVIHNDFVPKVPCICDYEELYSVIFLSSFYYLT